MAILNVKAVDDLIQNVLHIGSHFTLSIPLTLPSNPPLLSFLLATKWFVCAWMEAWWRMAQSQYLWVSIDALLSKQCFNLENEFTLKYVKFYLYNFTQILLSGLQVLESD